MISNHQKEINDRFIFCINKLRERNGIKSVASLAKELKVLPQHFSDVKVWKNRVSPVVLSLITERYPEFNVLFVLNGKGDPIKPPHEEFSEFSFLNEDPVDYINSLVPADFERVKLELLVAKTRCQTLEKALELIGKRIERKKRS